MFACLLQGQEQELCSWERKELGVASANCRGKCRRIQVEAAERGMGGGQGKQGCMRWHGGVKTRVYIAGVAPQSHASWGTPMKIQWGRPQRGSYGGCSGSRAGRQWVSHEKTRGTQGGSNGDTTGILQEYSGDPMGVLRGPKGDSIQGQSLHHPPPVSSQQTTRVDLFDLQAPSSQSRKRKGEHHAVEDRVHPGAERFLDVQPPCWFRGRSLDDGHCGIKAKQTSGEMRFSAFGVAAASFRGRWR